MAEKCSYCSAQLIRGAAFCHRCGKPVAGSSADAKTSEAPDARETKANKSQKWKKTLILAVIDLGLLVWIISSWMAS